MAEMGHTDPKLALQIYARAMCPGEGERDRLKALVEGTLSTRELLAQLAPIGTDPESGMPRAPSVGVPETTNRAS